MREHNPKLLDYDDGGDFPEHRHLSTKITLRDLFAMAALNGELAAQTVDEAWSPNQSDLLAERCYRRADCMLAERAKR